MTTKVKRLAPILLLGVGLLSCSLICEDCRPDPVSSGRYFIKNRSSEEITLIFYGDSSVLSDDTLILNSNDNIPFLYFSTGTPPQSALNFNYNWCDSLMISNISGWDTLIRDLEECKNSYDLFCRANYTLTKFEEVKKGKNKGDKYSEYELVLR